MGRWGLRLALALAAVAEAQQPPSAKGGAVREAPAERRRKGVYGTDDRTDESRAGSCVGESCVGTIPAAVRAVAGATVALVPTGAWQSGREGALPAVEEMAALPSPTGGAATR